MKILIINWRSINDPNSGGAEQVTLEHAKRWVKNQEAVVTWLSPKYKSDISAEEIEGVKFEYIGVPLGVTVSRLIFTFPLFYFLVFYNYLTKYKGKVDLIIEGVHGIPFLTNLYAKETVVLYVQEVAAQVWEKMYPFPINKIGKSLEQSFLRIYKNNKLIVGSKSAKKDLVGLGLDNKNIHIVNHGIKTVPLNNPTNKEGKFTVIFLNRVVKMKGVERGLKVFSKVASDFPDSQMWIVGKCSNEYKTFLINLCEKLQIKEKVRFFGFVDEQKKVELLQRAHVLINPSYLEGWGLVNIEANSQGTPVVAFDVQGSRDSVKNGVNGYLVSDNDIKAMYKSILKVKNDKELQQSSIEFSKQFTWEDKAKKFYWILKKLNK